MVFTKSLVLKVLGGLAVCTCVTVSGVKLLGRSENRDPEKSSSGSDGNQQSSQPTKNPAGDGVNSNPSNQNNAQNLQQQPQQNSPKPGSEEGTEPGSSTGDGVNSNTGNIPSDNSIEQPPQKPPGTEGNHQPSQPKPQNNAAGRSSTGAPSEADKSITNSGLKCTVDTTKTNNGECSGITEEKTINVKWEDGTKREGINSLTIPSGAKIKYEKYVADGDYKNYLKISIEGGDITLNGGTPETITKLEQFETYEIKEGEGSDKGKYYLSRKTTIFDHKMKSLNIPKTCQLVTNETEASCTLTADELKKINFDGKGSNDTTLLGNEEAKQSTLTILKTTDSEFTPEGYKFILKTNYTASLGSGSQNYKIISNTNTEFKIKKSGTALTLEKAWNLNTLSAKIGLTGCTTENSANECTLPGEINVFNSEDDKTVGATISGTNLKIKFLQDQPNYNQGFKFNTLSDIALSGGDPSVNDKKIESKGTYEIKKIEDKWYLAKVTTK